MLLRRTRRGRIILRDDNGEATGVVLDNAGDLALDQALPPSKALEEIYYQAVLAGQAELARNDITSVADARVFWRRGLQAWQRAARNDALTATPRWACGPTRRWMMTSSLMN